MKNILLTSLLLFFSGCSGAIQMGTVTDAHKSYEHQRYEKTLKLITQAESVRAAHPELKANLTYLKAQTYEALGEKSTARTLYEYLRDQHGDSQYGYLAIKKLGADNASTE